MAASVTIWHRLEPRVQESLLARGPRGTVPDPLLGGLQARVRDPMWMLARQLQLGELAASAAGSPVAAQLVVEDAPVVPIGPAAQGPAGPLEAMVERETVTLGLRGAVQLGIAFEELAAGPVAGLAPADAAALVNAFRAAFPIAAAVPADELPDPAATDLRRTAAGRVVNGLALLDAVAAVPGAVPPEVNLPPGVGVGAVLALLGALSAHRAELIADEAASAEWQPANLRYRFALASGTLGFVADEYDGDAIEWHDFALADAPPGALGDEPPASRTMAFLPQNVTFRGMPNARWWDFEAGETDFGALDVEHVDLPKLAVMQFALLYGNDWFELPVPVRWGTVSRVALLMVTDTFGVRTLVRPAEAQEAPGEDRWAMFRVEGPSGRLSDVLLLPPALGDVHDGADLEDVLFVRDEMAAMAWGIERRLHGPFDRAVDGLEPYLRRLAANPPPPPAVPPADAPPLRYVLGTTVPDNWIPLVPVSTAGRVRLRRGVMDPASAGGAALAARGRILEPWHPFYLEETSLPREGVRVTRYPRRARWEDGSTWSWMARRVRPGAGPGSSGLAFDTVAEAGA